MSMTDTRPIQFINTDHATVEKMLLSGKTPREISDLLAEPLPNVMGVWTQLRNDGRVEAKNFTAQVPATTQPAPTPQAVPLRPVHTPNPDLTQRIAGATDLLVKAADIDDKRIQGALARARKAMTDLAGLVTTWEGRSAARSKIARLEAELRIAKAELRTENGAVVATGGGPAKASYTRTPEEPVECRNGCGRMCATAAGRVSHERNCKGAA